MLGLLDKLIQIGSSTTLSNFPFFLSKIKILLKCFEIIFFKYVTLFQHIRYRCFLLIKTNVNTYSWVCKSKKYFHIRANNRYHIMTNSLKIGQLFIYCQFAFLTVDGILQNYGALINQ